VKIMTANCSHRLSTPLILRAPNRMGRPQAEESMFYTSSMAVLRARQEITEQRQKRLHEEQQAQLKREQATARVAMATQHKTGGLHPALRQHQAQLHQLIREFQEKRHALEVEHIANAHEQAQIALSKDHYSTNKRHQKK